MPTIDFGQVVAIGDGWVPIANRDSMLQINCNSDSADGTAAAAISFTASPLYYDRSEMLEMTTDGSNGVGILNRCYGQGNISNCSDYNSNNADAVKFDGTVSKTLELNVGINEIPIAKPSEAEESEVILSSPVDETGELISPKREETSLPVVTPYRAPEPIEAVAPAVPNIEPGVVEKTVPRTLNLGGALRSAPKGHYTLQLSSASQAEPLQV